MKAMLFAAGLGTRLRPITNTIPKALVPVNGKTLLQRNIEYLASFGITEVVVNVHHFADSIKKVLEDHCNFGVSVIISDESDEVLETAGGLKKAEPYLKDDDFVVMNVDILTNLNLHRLIEKHQQQKSLATLGVTNRKSSRVLLFDESMQLCGWKNLQTEETKISREKTEYQMRAFSGIHVISPEIFQYLELRKYSIIEPYLQLAAQHIITGFDHSQDILIDVGKHETLAQAEEIFK